MKTRWLCAVAATYHLIEFGDNGIGLDQQQANKIFNVFYRLHGKSEYEGTDIGLAIVKKVVENHHGFIVAQSEPGKGSWFRILFPFNPYLNDLNTVEARLLIYECIAFLDHQ